MTLGAVVFTTVWVMALLILIRYTRDERRNKITEEEWNDTFCPNWRNVDDCRFPDQDDMTELDTPEDWKEWGSTT